MRAKLPRRSSGRAARTQRTAPRTPSSKAWSQSRSESSSSVPALVGPAAHTSAFSSPQRRSTAPNAASTWNNLGATYLTAGRVDDAIEALSKALAIDPELATAHNGLGVAYARRGEMERASAEWRRALELRPDYPDARFNLERAVKGR